MSFGAGTAEELARDLNIDPASLRYRSAGINHMAFYLELERKTADGAYVNLYPELLAAYESGQAPKPNIHGNTRCQNIVRYEMFKNWGTSSPNRRSTSPNIRRGLSNRGVKI